VTPDVIEDNPKSKHEAQSRKGPDKAAGVLYVGIDLGTSRTSIAASNGVRAMVSSWVGYPKDVVSKKALKKEVLFGDEALANRLSLELFRPLGSGVIQHSDTPDTAEAKKHMKAAQDLIRHAITLSKPKSDELIYAVIGCPAQCSSKNKKAILEAIRPVVDSAIVASEPFTVAYGIDMLTDCLVIDIGAGTTDLCRMHGTFPTDADQVTNNFAGDHVDQKLFELLQKSCAGAAFSVHRVKEIKEKFSFVGDARDPVHVDLPVNGKPTRFEIGKQMREACRSIVPPMVDAIHQLIASFDPDFQSRLKGNVILGGGGSQMGGLREMLEQEMHERLGEGRVTLVDEPVYGGANGALKIAHDMPAEFWEKLK
jgi:rod shape-determining protein MreB and related proteins